MTAVAIILGVLCLVQLGVLLWLALRKPQNTSDSALLLKAEMTEINKSMMSLKDGMQKQLSDQLGTSNRQMQAQFAASAKIITDVTQKLTELDKTNQSVGNVANELKTLQNVLQNPKQRGVLGEYYLEQILKNMLPPGTYQLQYKMGLGLIVDAVVFLDDKILPIDSKFSLENYNRLVEAKAEDRPNMPLRIKK
jgi:DNA recombination protein RmuC